MAKKAKTKKPEPKPDRAKELAEIDALVHRLDTQFVPELTLETSIEECRQLADRFELVHTEVLDVESPQHYSDYGSFLRRVKTIQKRLEEQRVNSKEPHLIAGREVDARFKAFQNLADRIFVLFDEAMTVWDKLQETKRKKEEARLREIARKEEERLNRAAEKKAKKLEEQGREDEADAAREAVPSSPMPVVAQTNVPKVAGVSKPTKYYRAEMSDEDIRVQENRLGIAIAEYNAQRAANNDPKKQIIPPEYWVLDQKKLDAMARTLKGKLELPNVKVVDTPKRSVRV